MEKYANTTQNTSHAVMAQRFENRKGLDDFPTPPWATRALLEYVIRDENFEIMSCREPACGRGYMSRTLEEYFGHVYSSDIASYGEKNVHDFLSSEPLLNTDWLITNPPFNLAEEFIIKSLGITNIGTAVLVRSAFLEGKGRFQRLFSKKPPTIVAQFVERVPMVKGRIDRKASTATSYSWIVWKQHSNPLNETRVVWIPPCRNELEFDMDYPE